MTYPAASHKERPLSYSSLTAFKKSPMHYVDYLIKTRDQTTAMLIGSLAHCLVLEPHNFDKQYFCFDPNERPEQDKSMTSNANKAWKIEQYGLAAEQNKECIDLQAKEEAEFLAEKLMSHTEASQLINAAKSKELKRDWKYHGINCTSRMDLHDDLFIADLKFVADADPDDYMRKMFYYDYHIQSGMYIDADLYGKYEYQNPKDFYYIVMEKVRPYGIAIYRMRQEVIDRGVEIYRDLIDKYIICMRNNDWAGYEFKAPIGSNGLFEVGLPYNLR